jgi:SAM-dependent methyltransferase
MPDATPCPACGGTLAPAAGGLRRCTTCGSAVSAAPPTGSAALYAQPSERRLGGIVGSVLAVGTHEQLRLLGPLAAGSRVLDLGAGDGRLAAALAGAGHRVTAVEPFRAVPAAPGISVVRDGVDDVELPEHSFDAAVLWHVLEHLEEPLAALERVRRWLVPGGRVLVGVPNLASLQARLGGERWFHLDMQRHVVHLTPLGLVTLLERAGFTDLRRRRVLVEQGMPGMWMTLLNRVTGRPDALRDFVRHEETNGRDLALIAVVAVPLLPVAAVLELGAVAAGRGGALAVIGHAP